MRRGRLPQHLRVLGRRHGHVHDQRLPLHSGLRVLPRRHQQAAPRRPPGTRAGGRGRRSPRFGARGGDHSCSRRPSRRWFGGIRGDGGGHPPASSDGCHRVADLRLQRGPRFPGGHLRRGTGRAQPQRRDRASPTAGGSTVGLVCPQPGGTGPRQAGWSHHQVRDDPGDGGDLRGSGLHSGRPARGRRGHPHDGPVPAADAAPPAGEPLVEVRKELRPGSRWPARR